MVYWARRGRRFWCQTRSVLRVEQGAGLCVSWPGGAGLRLLKSWTGRSRARNVVVVKLRNLELRPVFTFTHPVDRDENPRTVSLIKE